MPLPPRERLPDTTILFALSPYSYIARACRRHKSDVFRTRIMLKPTVCMSGPEAARLFYDPTRFKRDGAAPTRLQKTLFGQGGVQGLDGPRHAARKAMFLQLCDPAQASRLAEIFLRTWSEQVGQWADQRQITLSDQIHPVLTQAVCEWAGVPVSREQIPQLSRRLRAMYDAAGDVGPRHWMARRARSRTERWASNIIQHARDGTTALPLGSPAAALAAHGDQDAAPLPPRTAAVELLNLLRPTTAVAVSITHLAHALHEHPHLRERAASHPDQARMFVHEVRRLYPFFPAVAAIVRKDFEWSGFRFQRGARALLDLHGTSTDPRAWDNPQQFLPQRFAQPADRRFSFIPQGGGDAADGHRCAGEWITEALMLAALHMLTRGIEYRVPPQDLRLNLRRLPALPRDGFKIDRIRPLSASPAPVNGLGPTEPAGCPFGQTREGGRPPSR